MTETEWNVYHGITTRNFIAGLLHLTSRQKIQWSREINHWDDICFEATFVASDDPEFRYVIYLSKNNLRLDFYSLRILRELAQKPSSERWSTNEALEEWRAFDLATRHAMIFSSPNDRMELLFEAAREQALGAQELPAGGLGVWMGRILVGAGLVLPGADDGMVSVRPVPEGLSKDK